MLCSVTALSGCSGSGGVSPGDSGSQRNDVAPVPIEDEDEDIDVVAVAPTDAVPDTVPADSQTGDENGDDRSGGEDTPKIPEDTVEAPDEPSPGNGDDGGVEPVRLPADQDAAPPLPDIEPTRPIVLLSVGHQQMCRVNVGDAMPALTLTDIHGNETSLAALYGAKLSVVLFWTADHPYAKEQFDRFEREIVKPYGQHGVATITINEGNSAEEVKAMAEQPAVEYPMLLDAEGTALSAVGTEKLPRTYLLDPSGRILWFDIEYSESTRRELKNAIVWHLTR
jgi:peroxiredoxin